MKILVVAPNYPNEGHPFSGIFNEKCVSALQKLCEYVEVLVPRPFVPPLFPKFSPRWKAYVSIPSFEIRHGVSVIRPTIPIVPRFGGAFWLDQGAFLSCRRIARRSHRIRQFDGIISFDLAGAGGIAWRLGWDLGIPASGWATGGDVRFQGTSSHGKAVSRAIRRLDFVFYQSHELLEEAARLLGVTTEQMNPARNIVLPRGIPAPPPLPRKTIRKELRTQLGVKDDSILLLNVGRISREKGIFELLRILSIALKKDPRITCIMVGSLPAFDETITVQQEVNANSTIKDRVKILPACNPLKVWEYYCAADIFAFTSRQEGMPNSLLEAMSMGLPAISFAIPPSVEIRDEDGALLTIPPFDCELFAQAVLRLANSPEECAQLGKKGKVQVLERFSVDKNMATVVDALSQMRTRSARSERAANM